MPFGLTLNAGRAYCLVCAKRRQNPPNVQAFRNWIKQEVAALDWSFVKAILQPTKIRGNRDAAA
jgi:LysR family glycine cleavage system transcriptional activator